MLSGSKVKRGVFVGENVDVSVLLTGYIGVGDNVFTVCVECIDWLLGAQVVRIKTRKNIRDNRDDNLFIGLLYLRIFPEGSHMD